MARGYGPLRQIHGQRDRGPTHLSQIRLDERVLPKHWVNQPDWLGQIQTTEPVLKRQERL